VVLDLVEVVREINMKQRDGVEIILVVDSMENGWMV